MSVNIENKGKYSIADTAYKDDQGKVAGKKVFSFGPAEASFKVLADPTAVGKTFEVTQAKNDKGYWDWTKLTEATGKVAVALSGHTEKSVGRATSNSTYATAEERAKVQVYIVKQSCLAQAVATLAIGAKVPPSTQSILEQAQKYVDFVFAEKAASINDLTDLPNDIPFDAEVA